MIRINLLPTKRKKKSKPIPAYLFGVVAALILSLVLVVGVNSYLSSTVAGLEKRKAENDAQKKQLEKKIKEVKDFEALNKKFTDRKNIIEELTKNQSLPAQILDELSSRLSEGVWLSSLSISNGKITIKGTGFSNSDIVNYIQNMKLSGLFTNVVLEGTVRMMVSDVETYTFNLTCEVKPPTIKAGGDGA